MYAALRRPAGSVTLDFIACLVADALVKAAREHGAPNTFGAWELEHYIGHRSGRMAIGRAGVREFALIRGRCAAQGVAVTSYERGRGFSVASVKD